MNQAEVYKLIRKIANLRVKSLRSAKVGNYRKADHYLFSMERLVKSMRYECGDEVADVGRELLKLHITSICEIQYINWDNLEEIEYCFNEGLEKLDRILGHM